MTAMFDEMCKFFAKAERAQESCYELSYISTRTTQQCIDFVTNFAFEIVSVHSAI
jgi:hypothetical protein